MQADAERLLIEKAVSNLVTDALATKVLAKIRTDVQDTAENATSNKFQEQYNNMHQDLENLEANLKLERSQHKTNFDALVAANKKAEDLVKRLTDLQAKIQTHATDTGSEREVDTSPDLSQQYEKDIEEINSALLMLAASMQNFGSAMQQPITARLPSAGKEFGRFAGKTITVTRTPASDASIQSALDFADALAEKYYKKKPQQTVPSASKESADKLTEKEPVDE